MYQMYPSSEVKTENEMTVEREMTTGGEVDRRRVTWNPVQQFSKKSGATKKKNKRMKHFRINLLLDHCRQCPYAPFPDIGFWPDGLKDYVVRCYATCKSEQEKRLLQDYLKEKIWRLYVLLWEMNWREENILELPVKTQRNDDGAVAVKMENYYNDIY